MVILHTNHANVNAIINFSYTGSTVVEHSNRDTMIKGSNLATDTGGEKYGENYNG
jgi:hypothetical protein